MYLFQLELTGDAEYLFSAGAKDNMIKVWEIKFIETSFMIELSNIKTVKKHFSKHTNSYEVYFPLIK